MCKVTNKRGTRLSTTAENFGEVMSGERRKAALCRVSDLLDAELKRLYGQGRADTMICNSRQIANGSHQRGCHRLSRFQHRLKDKAGLPLTVLTIPLSGEDQSLPPPSSTKSTCNYAPESIRTASDDYEEYDKISDEGFYNSSSRQTTVIDEPANTFTFCRVLYDFEPKHGDEIPVKTGECVVVEDRIGNDWLIGHVIGNGATESRSGRFPTSYVAF
uniref:SH3 domain-containing protein n=1 Tax=Heterorhabditis bacteriophora TaxID=37862 RepID=A0A1I7W739_HETBA